MSKTWLFARRLSGVAALSFLPFLAACGDKPQSAPQGMKVPVSVIQVQPVRAEINVTLPGRVAAIKDAEIRARVTGIVNDINFRQGSDVEEGQLLFTIDPASYEAARDQARAQLQQAKADVQAAESLANRYSRLIKANAVSRQEYDNAMAAAAQGRAAVAAAQATLKTTEIDLGYTEVRSPIGGRVGKSLVTEGALVSAANATLMAVVQQLDEVYVDLTRSTSELAQLRRALQSGELKQSSEGHAMVTVLLEDGTPYDQPGELLFSGVSVDPSTGQVSLRARVPNPEHILLPGMYVRVSVQQGVDEQALLVPDQAIQRGADGLSTLMLVRDETVQAVAVTAGPKVGAQTMIAKGLEAGDVVIVEGFQKIRPGAPVQPVPWEKADKGADSHADNGADHDAQAPAAGASSGANGSGAASATSEAQGASGPDDTGAAESGK